MSCSDPPNPTNRGSSSAEQELGGRDSSTAMSQGQSHKTYT
jgi:hypothetical protein